MHAAVHITARSALGASWACFAGAAACGVEALRTHVGLTSLGPICGPDRPGLFFLHCPAGPTDLGLLAASGLLALWAGRTESAAAGRLIRVKARRP